MNRSQALQAVADGVDPRWLGRQAHRIKSAVISPGGTVWVQTPRHPHRRASSAEAIDILMAELNEEQSFRRRLDLRVWLILEQNRTKRRKKRCRASVPSTSSAAPRCEPSQLELWSTSG